MIMHVRAIIAPLNQLDPAVSGASDKLHDAASTKGLVFGWIRRVIISEEIKMHCSGW